MRETSRVRSMQPKRAKALEPLVGLFGLADRILVYVSQRPIDRRLGTGVKLHSRTSAVQGLCMGVVTVRLQWSRMRR